MILASNHRSFLDPFAIGCCIGRPIYFVAKRGAVQEPAARLVPQLPGRLPGAPRRVRRGVDEDRARPARARRGRGDLSRGHAHPPGSLRRPKRGVGRLALESGKPVVPIAVTGSEHARDGWKIKPVQGAHPLRRRRSPTRACDDPSPFLAGEVTERIWPCVELQWEWLGGLPPLRTAAVVGAGAWARRSRPCSRARASRCSSAAAPPRRPSASPPSARTRAYLPGVELRAAIEVKTVPEIELAGWTSSCSPCPARASPPWWARSARGWATARRCSWPRRASCRRSAPRRPPTFRARACPRRGRARPAPRTPARRSSGGASVVVATRDPDLRRQLARRARGGRPDAEATDDVTGAELAACAKNAAALGSAAAAPRRCRPGRRRGRAASSPRCTSWPGERRAQRDLRRPGRRGRSRGQRHRRRQPQSPRGRAARARRSPGRDPARAWIRRAESLDTSRCSSEALRRRDAPADRGSTERRSRSSTGAPAPSGSRTPPEPGVGSDDGGAN